MDPDKIQIQPCCERQQGLFCVDIDAGLGNLPQENVAGMNVNAKIRSGNVLHDFCSHMLCYGSLLASRKNPVHVQVKHRNTPGYGVHAQGI